MNLANCSRTYCSPEPLPNGAIFRVILLASNSNFSHQQVDVIQFHFKIDKISEIVNIDFFKHARVLFARLLVGLIHYEQIAKMMGVKQTFCQGGDVD